MKKFFALLLTVSLCLLAVPGFHVAGRAQSETSSKFREVANPIPGSYIVVLKGTDLSPIVDPTPDTPPPAGEESPTGPAMDPAPSPVAAPDQSPTPAAEQATTASSSSLTTESFLRTATAEQSVAAPAPTSSPAPSPTPAPSPSPAPSPTPQESPTPDPDVIAIADDLTSDNGGSYDETYGEVMKGFHLNATEAEARAISDDDRVEFVQQDGVVTADPTQFFPPWGLDRIDQRFLPLSRTYTFNSTGWGVNAYVIDTGIYPWHADFNGRAFIVADTLGGNGVDCNGHGTHVAGTIGGYTFGVAKNVRLFGVRVLNCAGSGSIASVINGVNFVTWHRQLPWFRFSPAVANMSLGGSANLALDIAVRNSIRANVTYVIAAGNSNADARLFSPARVQEAITVGATDWMDNRAGFSNWGPGLDLFAPGVQITSAWTGSPFAVNTISGTSMATPHVTGVAAQYLQINPWASPAVVSWVVNGIATPGVVRNPGPGSPNRLLFTYF